MLPKHLTQHLTQHLPEHLPHQSGKLQRNGLIIRYTASLRVLKTQLLHCQSDVNLRAVVALHRRILTLDDLRQILLRHVVQIQFLNAGGRS